MFSSPAPLLSNELLKNSSDVLGVVRPGVLLCGATGVLTEAPAQLFIVAKCPDEFRQPVNIIRQLQNETVHAGGDNFCAAIAAGDHYRQTTSHGFNGGQSKRIMQRWADISVRGGVELHHIGRRGLEAYAPVQPQALNGFLV